jgi:hypothetical protein
MMKAPPPSGDPLANPKEFLGRFAEAFVVSSFRDRFVHEAMKKPQRLATRICHSIEEIFAASFRGGESPFEAGDACIPISGTALNPQRCRWSDLAPYVRAGAGALIASENCDRFYAETESEQGSPYRIYTGSKL